MKCPECGKEMEKFRDTGDWRYTELHICNNITCSITRVAIG